MNAPSFTRFCGHVGLQLTPGQEVIARIAIDGESIADLPDHLAARAREIFGPVEWPLPQSAVGVVGLVVGARSGKSLIFESAYSLYRAVFADLSPLGPGEVACAVVVGPDLRLAQIVIRYVEGLMGKVPQLARFVTRATQTAITITRPDGGKVAIEALPASEAGRSLRGRSLVSAVLAEAAFFRADDSAVSDADLFAAVAPRIIRGGLVVVSSTPWAESGLLHELHAKNWGCPKTALVAHATTEQMRDDAHTLAIVARERARDPENAEREYDAQFGSKESSLFVGADVDAAVGDYTELPAQRGYRYVGSYDAASRTDLFVCTIGHRELAARKGAPPVDRIVVDCARDWRPQGILSKLVQRRVDLDAVEVELAELARHYRCGLHGDSWSFDVIAHLMKKRGTIMHDEPMHPGAQGKRASLLTTLFRQRRIVLPKNAELVKHLKALRIARSPGGTVRFFAPERKGSHDDYAKSLMILAECAVKLPACGGDIRCVQDPLFWIDGRIGGGSRRYYTVNADGSKSPSAPPIGSLDHQRAQADRFARGIYTPGDVDELGEAEVELRIARGGSPDGDEHLTPDDDLRAQPLTYPISPTEEAIGRRLNRSFR